MKNPAYIGSQEVLVILLAVFFICRFFFRLALSKSKKASSPANYVNRDVVLQLRGRPLEEVWKAVTEVILSKFDHLEMADKDSMYLRTDYHGYYFKGISRCCSVRVRTRAIVKSGGTDAITVKLISEVRNDGKNAQWKEWDRCLHRYSGIIADISDGLKSI